MGMHVASPTEGGSIPSCPPLIHPSAPRGRQGDRHMSLPSPVELSSIEIENAHTPLPRGGGGNSPTEEVVARSPRRNHPGKCFVTLKRKGSRDVVRQTHVRSASSSSRASGGGGGGGSLGGTTPKETFLENFCFDSYYAGGSGQACSAAPSPRDLQTAAAAAESKTGSSHGGGDGGGGGSRSRHGSWAGGVSSIASLEDAAQRIAVDPDSGHSYFVERSTVCDACPYCDDVCEVAWCNGCDERRAHLEEVYGPLILAKAETAGRGDAGGGSAYDRLRSSSDPAKSNGSGGRLAPTLSRRYPRKSSYTECEIRRRKLTGACWVVSQGSVYDVTGALADHPGGKRSVLRNAGGRDCEEDFFFHSKAAKKQWRQYRIGSLIACRGEGGEGDGAERSMRTGSDCVIS